MPINPASIQSVRYDYPNPQPSAFDNFGALANAALQGYFNRKTQKKEEIGKLLPVLAQMKMLQPGTAGAPGNMPYAGMNWQATAQGQDWGDINSQLLAQERMDTLANPNRMTPAQAATTFWNTRAGDKAWSSGESPEAVARKIFAVQQAWNKIVKEGLPSTAAKDTWMTQFNALTPKQKKQAKTDPDVQKEAQDLGIDLTKL